MKDLHTYYTINYCYRSTKDNYQAYKDGFGKVVHFFTMEDANTTIDRLFLDPCVSQATIHAHVKKEAQVRNNEKNVRDVGYVIEELNKENGPGWYSRWAAFETLKQAQEFLRTHTRLGSGTDQFRIVKKETLNISTLVE